VETQTEKETEREREKEREREREKEREREREREKLGISFTGCLQDLSSLKKFRTFGISMSEACLEGCEE